MTTRRELTDAEREMLRTFALKHGIAWPDSNFFITNTYQALADLMLAVQEADVETCTKTGSHLAAYRIKKSRYEKLFDKEKL
jgi:hypothetical protein